MYNLFISGNEDNWEGAPYELEISRVFEYTDDEIKGLYQSLKQDQIAELKKFPCLFAYEIGCEKPPKFGMIKSIKKRQDKVIIEYDIIAVVTQLNEATFKENSLKLDIDKKFELRRTHWAIKDVNLEEELEELGVDLPHFNKESDNLININYHNFDIAFSFPGDARALVEPIVTELNKHLKPNALFYDFNYQSQLARPSLDILLQDIYGKRSKLNVVFLSGDYERKEWCGIEFRAIKEIIMEQNFDKVMYIKMDDEPVRGVLKTDGFIDSRKHSVQKMVQFILERSKQQLDIRKQAFSYVVNILTPENDQHLLNPVLVKGTFKSEPPPGLFFCFEFNPQIGTYWPKNQIFFNKQRNDWTTKVSMGVGDDMERYIYIVAVGSAGLTIIDDHRKNGMISGLDNLSNDMIIVDERHIILGKE
jgi:hypothetical protein